MCEIFSVTSAAFTLCIQVTTYGGFAEDPFTTESFQSGMNVFMTQDDYEAQDDFIWSVQLLLDRLATTNVDAVSLTWPVFTESVWSNRVYAGAQTPDDEAIATFVAIAKARGFEVILHPLLDEAAIVQASPTEWRGTIRPQNVSSWFSSYGRLMVDYAELAESVGADAFVVGAEFNSMERYRTHWTQLVTDMREAFPSGAMSYASNRFISTKFPWETVDFISVDAFFALDVPMDASVTEMTAELELQRVEMVAQAEAIGLPLVFTEIGTTSQAGSFQRTWVWNHRSQVDHVGQARYYEAVCDVWQSHLAGLYWWTTTLNPAETGNVNLDESFDPYGKPAETAVRECFATHHS